MVVKPKVFSLEEAEALLPTLSRKFEKIFSKKQRVREVADHIQDLFEIWGKELLKETNMDNKYYREKLRKKDALSKEMQKLVEEITSLGCFVKDLNVGLVDFYFQMGDDLVYLCWRVGEDKIRHWHALNEGMAGRRPVSELMESAKSK